MAAALAILTEALDEPGTDIEHSLHRLTLDAAAAIPSHLGRCVVVSHSDPPFAVTALADGGRRRRHPHLAAPESAGPQ